MDSRKRIASVLAAGAGVFLSSPTFALAQTTEADEVVETGSGGEQAGDRKGDGARGTGKGKGNEAEPAADEPVDDAEQTTEETVDEAEQTADGTVDESEQTVDETVGGGTDPATGAIGDAPGVAAGAGAVAAQTASLSPPGDRGPVTSGDGRIRQRSADGKIEQAGRNRATVQDTRAVEQRREGAARLRDIVSSGNLVAGPAPVPKVVESEADEDSGLSLSLPLTGSELMGLVRLMVVLVGGGGLLWFAAGRASRKRALLLRRADAGQ